MHSHPVILVQKSRRPTRWLGVAMLAAMLTAIIFLRHETVVPVRSSDAFQISPLPFDSFASVLDRGQADGAFHSAQWTGFAFSSSTSTDGETPTR